MANTSLPEQEDKSSLPQDDVPEFLRRREDLYNPDAKDNKPSGDASDPRGEGKASPDELNKAEKEATKPSQHENTVGQGYKAGAGEHHSTWKTNLLKTRKRKAAFGGSIAALLVGAAIVAFLSLIPLKILHVVNNLQSRFYATTQNAVEKETDQLFSRYVLGKMLNGCRGVYIDQNCNPYNGTSLVNKLYRGWSDGRLEEKLRTQTGLEIRKNTLSEGYELRFTGGDTIDLEGLKQNKTIAQLIDAKGEWSAVKKSEVRGIYKSALKATTRQASAMYYFKVTPYLGKKFGIKWCVIGCDKREGFDKWQADKKFGAKMWLAERVLGPREELYKMIMTCLYSGSDFCSRDKVLNATPTSYSADAGGCKLGCTSNGRPVSESLNEMETKLVSLAAAYGSDHDSLRKAFDRFEKTGFINAMVKSLATTRVDDEGLAKGNAKLGDKAEAVAKVSSKAVPIIGWIITASYAAEFINDAPDTIARLQYMTNTAAMTQLWSMYRTVADETKEGQVDAEVLGSFVNALGPGLQPSEGGDKQIGGTSGAEATPLYQEIVSNGPGTDASIASLVRTLVSPTASAEAQNTDKYICNDGSPPPAGQLVCAEERLNGSGFLLKALGKINLGLIADAASFVNDSLDTLTSTVINAVCSIINLLPGSPCDALEKAINALVSKILKFGPLREILQQFASWMLGINLNMVSNNMSGGRTFDMLAAGADVSGNDYAHHGIGGVALTPQQVAENLNYQQDEQLAAYKHKPLIAQLTDTESPYSPVAKLALAMPTSTTALFTGVNNAWSSFVTNPFGKLANSFASIFTLHTRAAGFVPGKDPFGITQYGYPLDDPIFNQNPDEYWKNYCTDTSPYKLTQAWNEFAANNKNPENFEPENTQTAQFAGSVPGNKYGTNGCLLIQAAVGSAGAIFTDGVLSAEELATSNTGSGGGGGVSCEGGYPDQSAGTADQLPAGFADLVASNAPGRTCPDFKIDIPSSAIPNDGRQYFAYDGCGDDKCAVQTDSDGRKYFEVKYRDPPLGGNSVKIYVP
jgi:hypothetical protein